MVNRYSSPVVSIVLQGIVLALVTSKATAASDDTIAANSGSISDRYGVFGLLDHRSMYGTYWYPEPLHTDESDVDNEIRLDWFHGEMRVRQDDQVKLEIEKSFGLFTFEVAPTWESDRTLDFDPATGMTARSREQGFGNVELGGRFPFYQYVSSGNFFDTTLVFGMEAAAPTRTRISKDWELVPKVFNLTRLGEHLAIQTGLGDSIRVGPEGRGLSTLEYSMTLGYELTKDTLPLPLILSSWPIFEFEGERTINQGDAGHDALFATAGIRLNFDSIRWLPAQPRIGIGYSFPLDKGARDEFRWGIVMSLIFEY